MSKGKIIEIYGKITEQKKVKIGDKQRIDLVIEDEEGGQYYVQSRPNTFEAVEKMQPDIQRVFYVKNLYSRRVGKENGFTFHHNNLILQQVY